MSAPAPPETRYPAPSAPPAEPAGWPLGRVLFGLLLLAAGVGWLLERLGVWSPRWEILVPAALIIVGICCVVAAWDAAQHGGLIALGVLLSLAVIALVLMPRPLAGFPLTGGAGDRVERPASVADLEPRYDLGAGALELDLTGLEVTRRVEVDAQVGMGQLVVRVPEGVPVSVAAEVGAGEANLLGNAENGLGVEHEMTTPGFAGAEQRVDLRLQVGLGNVEVTR